jgi:peptidoglycan/LPS O-acetylase OafA/YrhL
MNNTTGVSATAPAVVTRSFYPGLQAVRGLACLAVLIQHAYGYAHVIAPGPTAYLDSFNLGGTGIMLFFALSAFIMLERSGDAFGKFVWDRLRRIFPLLWLSLIVAGTLSYYVMGASGLRWTTFLLIPTTVPAYVPVPFWSLSFELFFYLLVAVAGLGGYRGVVTGVLAWCALGIIFHEQPYHSINHALYPQPYPFFITVFGFFFAAGILARAGFNPASRGRWLYAAGAIAIYGAVYQGWMPLRVYSIVPADRHGTFIWTLLGFGAFLTIRAAALWTPRSWPAKMCIKLGDYSYGIYLMHMSAMMVVNYAVQKAGIPMTFTRMFIVILGVSLGLSLLWGMLDVRMQRAFKRWRRTRPDTSPRPAPLPAPLTPDDRPALS